MFGVCVIRTELPHTRKLPSHFVSTYDILRVSMLSATWCTGRLALKGTTSSRKPRGAWSKRCVRVRASHCTNWPAALMLPRPYGNFQRGHPDSTTLFWSTSFGKLHKQRSAFSGCVSVFRSYCQAILFALSIRYQTLALCNPHRLHKARALPWVEVVCGESGMGDNCSPELPLLCVLVCWYLPGGRRGVTRARLIRRMRLVICASCT